MKKIFLYFFLLGLILIFPSSTIAAIECNPFSPKQTRSSDTSVTFNVGPTVNSLKYALILEGNFLGCQKITSGPLSATGGSISHTYSKTDSYTSCLFRPNVEHKVSLYEYENDQIRSSPVCTSTSKVVSGCSLELVGQSSIDTETPVSVKADNFPATVLQMRISGPGINPIEYDKPSGAKSFTASFGAIKSPGIYKANLGYYTTVLFQRVWTDEPLCPTLPIKVGPRGQPIDNQPPPGGGPPGQPPKPFQPETCGSGNTGLQTAVGCIPIQNTNEFAAWFLKWAIGIAGGIAFLLILFSGFQIMTASGSPEKLQGGREMLTAAISGLILIIFSVFLLRLIGVEILRIPGL